MNTGCTRVNRKSPKMQPLLRAPVTGNIKRGMKSYFIKVISFFNILLLKINGVKSKGLFYLVRINQTGNNIIHLKNVDIRKTLITVNGNDNTIVADGAFVENSNISISGTHNRLTIADGVKLRCAQINIRGERCSIEINKNTKFGGIRLINVGSNNYISIGENCMFSDQVEVWASDTHPIFNEQGKWLNPEEPIVIGNNVWVGSRVIILKGIKIGDGSVVGMGTIVTKDIASNVISAGFPNREIQNGIRWETDYPLQ